MRDIFTPSLIWDLALIAVILFVMIRSVGRGFVSSFIHLLGLAAACIVAALLSGKAAAWLYDGYLAERLQTAVSDTLRQKLQTFAELLDRIDPTDTITAIQRLHDFAGFRVHNLGFHMGHGASHGADPQLQ
mgnify:CR=1 FL=1